MDRYFSYHLGDYIHVTGVVDQSEITIDNSSATLVILHPDTLISATHVADAFECQRKAILQTRVRASGEASKYMVYGNIVHRLLQMGLTLKNFSIPFLSQALTQIISESTEDLYQCNIDESTAISALQEHIGTLSKWGSEFVGRPPRLAKKSDNNNAYLGTINKVLDIEERIWSPMYGIKGNIDATVQFDTKTLFGTQAALTPFEFKTGKKTSSAHDAQTALYTLLLTDKYGAELLK